ncbi:MAG: L-ribulose-5-phosphate 3-epimerase [Anaerolineae bacterium]|nr:L-ribulose-5-phosphate 3-epimerase [Anaerolineae bacterium]MCZ7554062.1 L-ribulose-5-phosphate 3-epimerase [Anaerolineales bacterium]
MLNFGNNPLGIYEKAFPADLSWEERLNQAAKAGYDFLEMSIDDSDERLSRLEWPRSARLALRLSMENTGVPILTMGLSGHRKFPLGSNSAQTRSRGLDMLYRAIELAYDLDARVIQLMGYDVFYETSDAGTQARFIEGLIQGARCASAAGVMLALENVDVETVDSVEKALRFVREVNSPWLNVYPDMGNLAAAGYDPVEQINLAKGRLVGIHVKDALPGEVRGVIFEQGIVPFSDVFQTLAELAFSGPLVVEMWAHLDRTGDPVRAAADANQLVRSLVKTADKA